MKIGPRYKIARRLGAHVFDKTQTAKYAARAAAKDKGMKPRPKSDYGIQLLEKQKARFTYGVNERQFQRYIGMALSNKKAAADASLYEILETRLDNVVYRMGLAASRAQARQLVAHGHITVDGRKVTIPSFAVSVGEKVAVRGGSAKKRYFETATDKMKQASIPVWIKADVVAKEGQVQAMPKYAPTETQFDVNAILEFYRRS